VLRGEGKKEMHGKTGKKEGLIEKETVKNGLVVAVIIIKFI
jgi:hypothetical protein